MEMIVENQLEPIRIDKYLAGKLDYSRQQIISLISDKQVLVNADVVKASALVSDGDEISLLSLPQVSVMNAQPEEMELNVVYEDEDLIVIDKPSGLVVHPAAGNFSGTLVNALLHHSKNLSDINGDFRPGIVHRLDKDTSGLLVVAKNNEAHLNLQTQLQARDMRRTYLALVEGNVDVDTGTIKAPIGRDPKNRLKQAVVSTGKPAVTHFEVVQKFFHSTLLKCRLESGRTHQIRVHMTYIKHPIIGDQLYGNKKKVVKNGQLLHACRLEFRHPVSQKTMVFESPLPEEFKDYIKVSEGVDKIEY